jgi:hypothetical protein
MIEQLKFYVKLISCRDWEKNKNNRRGKLPNMLNQDRKDMKNDKSRLAYTNINLK